MEELRPQARVDDPPRPLPTFAELLRRFPVTAALTAVTALVFGLQLLVGLDLAGSLRLGAVRGDLVWRGDLYRLLCPVFLHAAWWHFAINWFAFLQLAGLTEYLWGSWRLAAVYLASGIGASLLSAALHTAPTPSVGASGAILGLAGLLLGAALFAREPARSELRGYTGRCLPISVGFTFAIGIAAVASGVAPIVDNWAHAGGFVVGFLFSLAWRRPRRRAGWASRILAAALTAAAVGSLVWMAVDGAEARRHLGRDFAARLLQRLEDAPPAERLAEVGEWVTVLMVVDEEAVARRAAPYLFQRERLLRDLAATDAAPALHQVTVALSSLEHPLAREAAERWLEVDPDAPDALNILAWHLVTGPPQRRDPARALALSRRSLEELPPGDGPGAQSMRAAFLDTQAEALLQLGRPREALPLQEEAVAIGRVQGHPALPEMAQRLIEIRQAIAAVGSGARAGAR